MKLLGQYFDGEDDKFQVICVATNSFCHFGNFVRVTGISFLEVPFTTLISFSAESGEGPEERRQDCQRQVLLIKSCFSSWS